MAELTNLETKLGEVIGLAMAAQAATKKVSKLVEKEGSDELAKTLQTMSEEAAQAEKRATDVAAQFKGKKAAILKEARTVKGKAADMMSTYLDKDADALDGLEFLAMAEAAETGHWEVLKTMNRKARNPRLKEITDFVLPIQQRHLKDARTGLQKIAAQEDPNQEA